MCFFNFRRLSMALLLLVLTILTHSAQAQSAFSYSGKLASTANGIWASSTVGDGGDFSGGSTGVNAGTP